VVQALLCAAQDDMYLFTVQQIADYVRRARESDPCSWAGSAEAMLS
jgi:hypothetical protein